MNSLMSRYDPNLSAQIVNTSTSQHFYKPLVSSYTMKEERTPKSVQKSTASKRRNSSTRKNSKKSSREPIQQPSYQVSKLTKYADSISHQSANKENNIHHT
jgi:hypothetical protein